VNDDVATVDLTEDVRAADPRRRQLLLAQLEATLGQLSTISRVRITVQRLALDVPAVSSESATPTIDPVIDSRPVVIASSGRIGRLERGSVRSVGGVAGLAVRGASHPAVAYDSSAYAVLNAKRNRLLVQMPGAMNAAGPVKAAGLTAPSFDVEGRVWTAAASGGRVYVAGATTPAVKLKASWLRRYTVVALRISRDGTRAALAVRSGSTGHVLVCGVLRNSSGQPSELSGPQELLPDLVSVSDLTWVDENHLAVLGRRAASSGSSSSQPWLVQVGGAATPVTPVPGAVSLTAGNGDSSLLAATSSSIYMRVGARWIKAAAGKAPAYPG
jgi:lipoprotein LpqB-like beta-propeller protein/sporulation and spore germination protein